MVTQTAKKTKKKKERRRSIRRTIEIIGAVAKKAVTGKQRRGFKAEERTAQTLRYWQKKGFITAFRQTPPFSSEDMAKQDFIVTLLDGREAPIQVKNHCNLTVVGECREANVFLYFIGQDESDEVAKERMRDVIMSIYLSVFRLEPHEIRQLALKILATKNVLQLLPRFSLKRILSQLGKVFS